MIAPNLNLPLLFNWNKQIFSYLTVSIWGMTVEIKMSEKTQWSTGLFVGCCATNFFTCFYATLFPCCALASAKTMFDGSDYFFNSVCFSFNPAVVRNYIRSGYGIEGQVGVSDCCISSCCCTFVIAQLLNEVSIRGPRIESMPSATAAPWSTPAVETGRCGSSMNDPCDSICTFMTAPCEVINIYSTLSNTPFWFGYCHCVNICQTRHLIRKSYGIGGNDCVQDCLTPCVCLMVPCIQCAYFYDETHSLKGEIMIRGEAPNFTKNNWKQQSARNTKKY